MSVDAEEEDVLLSEFDTILSAPPQRPALDDMVKRDVEADLQDIRRPLPPSSISLETVEATLTQSKLLNGKGIQFSQTEPKIWKLLYQQHIYSVTFSPEVFEESPALRLMTWADPLFERLLLEGATK